MKLKSISLKSYRRFTDLRIINLPATAKLIVLCGPNGSGKSSLFDAFRSFQSLSGGLSNYGIDHEYHDKYGAMIGSEDARFRVGIEFHEEFVRKSKQAKKIFAFRTAFRNDPDFKISSIQNNGSVLDEPRSTRSIENDSIVKSNYSRLVTGAINRLFSIGDNDPLTAYSMREAIISVLRDAINRIYPELKLTSLGDPMGEGTFFFEKGSSKDFPYKNLSAGEKSVLDLLLDLVVRREYFDDTIWCIDEPESHLNTRVQGALLRELVEVIPENSQLVVATHSIGFMQEASVMQRERPGSVIFLDFQDHDFDTSVEIRPSIVTRDFWKRTLDVALGELARLVAPEKVVLCEGTPAHEGVVENADFDSKCYMKIFANEYPNVDFISVGNSKSVTEDRLRLGSSIQTIVDGTEVIRLVDRDDRSKSEVDELLEMGVRVLSRRNIESFLLHDDVLVALAKSVGRDDDVGLLLDLREDLLMQSVQLGNPADDYKKISKSFRGKVIRLLSLSNAGSTWAGFAVDTLAPLIRGDMAVYKELRKDIFDR